MSKSKKKSFKEYFSEGIAKLPSGKLWTALIVAILLGVILYLVILFFSIQ
ncbi:MAG TPA: hypothetical protein P5311_02260 [Candidatus Dojkabacteria bacterium]|jgi:nicotinamide riboside transporter PnuC|nr:hypothetical protein [Candidatus Dojkabacteria bacterium]